MSDISKGDTFVDGQAVTGARLNQLVDSAVILDAFITGKAAVVPASGDYIIIYDVSTAALKKALISNFPAVTSVGLALPAGVFNVTGSPVTDSGTLTAAFVNQTTNKVLAAPDGTTGAPTFRLIAPQDIAQTPTNIAASNIDWSLNYVFEKTVTTNLVPTFTNTKNGQTIRVLLIDGGGATVGWSAITGLKWPGGIAPGFTGSTGDADLYQFTKVGTSIYGSVIKNLS